MHTMFLRLGWPLLHNISLSCTFFAILLYDDNNNVFHRVIVVLAETVKSQARKPKCSKGYHCSRNAYMLVYKRQVEESDSANEMEINIELPGESSLREELRRHRAWLFQYTTHGERVWNGHTNNCTPLRSIDESMGPRCLVCPTKQMTLSSFNW